MQLVKYLITVNSCRCAWESLVLGHNRFCEMGVRTIRNVAVERLRLAAEQLPNRSEGVHNLTLSLFNI